jgi:hypothetical protein
MLVTSARFQIHLNYWINAEDHTLLPCESQPYYCRLIIRSRMGRADSFKSSIILSRANGVEIAVIKRLHPLF